jgi:pimeloyl-ACP methyl ester carboxylesterase
LVNARYVARTIPDATLEVMAGAGHLLLLDQAVDAAPHITRFLCEGR